MKILLVDDHILFREGLLSLLNGHDEFSVVGEAGTVSQAFTMAIRLRPDLILMDFSLPDGTGLDATKRILAEIPDCMIVFMTVHDTDEDLFAAIRLGAKGYLLKNIPIKDLLSNLKAIQRGEFALSRVMSRHIIEEFARMEQPASKESSKLSRLSQRELELLRLLSTGTSNHAIAERLFISENTVKHHLHSIMTKLELKDRSEAAHFARVNGLIPNTHEPEQDITLRAGKTTGYLIN